MRSPWIAISDLLPVHGERDWLQAQCCVLGHERLELVNEPHAVVQPVAGLLFPAISICRHVEQLAVQGCDGFDGCHGSGCAGFGLGQLENVGPNRFQVHESRFWNVALNAFEISAKPLRDSLRRAFAQASNLSSSTKRLYDFC